MFLTQHYDKLLLPPVKCFHRYISLLFRSKILIFGFSVVCLHTHTHLHVLLRPFTVSYVNVAGKPLQFAINLRYMVVVDWNLNNMKNLSFKMSLACS